MTMLVHDIYFKIGMKETTGIYLIKTDDTWTAGTTLSGLKQRRTTILNLEL